MTFVGKILVILIMAFSLVFLGISTVVFTTATNWSDKSKKQASEIQKIQGQLADAQDKAKQAETKYEAAKKEHETETKAHEVRVADLQKQVTAAEGEMTQARSQLETAQKNAQVALAEATARKGQIDVLNETLAKAQTQANEFNAQNIELTDQKRILEREKATLEQNARDLRDFKAKAVSYLADKGIPLDKLNIGQSRSVSDPVEGRVVEVDATRRSMEISIGSDDGLAVGNELYVFRIQPRAEYIGKVRIEAVYPDKAVAKFIGNTVNGKRVQENDIVSSTFFHSK